MPKHARNFQSFKKLYAKFSRAFISLCKSKKKQRQHAIADESLYAHKMICCTTLLAQTSLYWCNEFILFQPSRYHIRQLSTILSINLHIQLVSEIGRQLDGSNLSSLGLGIGTIMVEVRRLSGNLKENEMLFRITSKNCTHKHKSKL